MPLLATWWANGLVCLLSAEVATALTTRLPLPELGADEDDDMVDKIVFIKTQSTGSSTLTSILHRFCDDHQRRCFVHPAGTHPGSTANRTRLKGYVEEEEARARRFKQDPIAHAWRPLDIWPNHAVLEADLFDRLVPGNVKISIFRRPIERVLSSFSHGPELPANRSRAEEVQDILTALRAGERPQPWCGPAGFRLADSVPLADFDKLDFVLLTEKFDLSLILLRRRLRWRTHDIMYLKLKDHQQDADLEASRQHLRQYLTLPDDNITQPTRFLKEHCIEGEEAAVYHKAHDKFDQQFSRLSTRVQEDVAEELEDFGRSLASVADCCERDPDDAYCQRLVEDNVPWVIRQRQTSLRGLRSEDCSSGVREWGMSESS